MCVVGQQVLELPHGTLIERLFGADTEVALEQVQVGQIAGAEVGGRLDADSCTLS